MSAVLIWMFVKRWWPYILAAAAMLALLGYIGTILVQRNIARHQLAEREIRRLEEINQRTMESFERYQADVERGRVVEIKRDEARRTEAASEAPIQREIINAPATDDGPLAPVLRDALGSLRELGGVGLHPGPATPGEPAPVP